MLRKTIAVVVILAMAIPGLLAALPATQGLPILDTDRDLLVDEAGQGADYSGPMQIHLVVGTYDPIEEDIMLSHALRTTTWDGLFLIQFIGPTLPRWEERVEELGCDLVSYIPDNAFIAKMSRDARRSVVDLPYVRWVGPYHPGYRVSPELWMDPDPVLGLAIIPIEDSAGLAQAFLDRGGAVESVGNTMVQGLLPRSSLASLARFGGVEWVERWLEPELFNDHSARLIGARQSGDGPWMNNTLRLWRYNDTIDVFEGITGAGYVVSAADTGLDGQHGSFVGKIPSVSYVGSNVDQDTYGHGTHVLGTAAGTGLPYPTDSVAVSRKYIGVAPEANVFSQDIFEGVGFFRNFDVIGRDAAQAGAVVNSNSWGEYRGGSYTANEVAYDSMTRDAIPGQPGDQPVVFCFSAGNAGPGDRTLGSPGAAKNIITVGATGNDRNGASAGIVVGFSSGGPAADGRVKPDVVASGHHVISAAARPPNRMPFQPPADGGVSWTSASGTSMSCPAVAGAVAEVHDYSYTMWDEHTPSPAMVKALMINGADKISSGSGYPNSRQGWGRVNLTKLVETPNYRTFFYDQETLLRYGGRETQRYIFAVEPGQRTVKITLVWTDYVGTASASKALVSDLDLVVTDPMGNVYRANNFDGQGRSISGEDTNNDTVNNVEKIVLTQAREGFYSIQIIARNTPAGAQDFALVAQGDLRDKWRDLVAENVTLNKEELDEGEPIVFSGDIVGMGNLPIMPFHYEVYLLDKETDTKTIFEEGTISDFKPWDSRHFSHRWVSTRGDWEFGVDVDTGNANKEFSKRNNKVTMDRFVKGYGLLAELIPTNVVIWPGLEAHLEVNVLNIGNVIDTFTMSTEGIPVGWKVELDATEITLNREKTGTITMRVTPPSAAKAGEIYPMNVKITSMGNSTYKADLTSRATVGHVHGLRSDLAEEGTSVLPGYSVVHLINITNTGNGDDSYDLNVYGLPPGWIAVFSEETITIEDNVTKVVTLELESPEKAIHGAIAELDITVTSSTGKSETLTARTQVRHTTGMDATIWAEDTVLPGKKVQFFIDIFNLGNGNDEFYYVETLPQGWTSTFPLKEVDLSLEAFETWNGSGEFKSPATARAGTYEFKVQVYTQESIKDLVVNVEVEEVYGASVIPMCGVSAIYPGNSTEMCLAITSLCNLPTEYGVELIGAPSDWTIVYDPRSETLETLKTGRFNLTVGTPRTTPKGMYDLTIGLSYGPTYKEYNFTLYVMELPSSVDTGPDNEEDGFLTSSAWLIIIVVIAVLVIIVVATRARGRPKAVELEFEEEEVAPPRARPLPPPPPPGPAPRRTPPPPPPPKTVDELLAGTSALDRVSETYDRYSADVDYASGATLSQQGEPLYVGDCPKCGAKVLEYPSGALMCASCGSQFTDH